MTLPDTSIEVHSVAGVWSRQWEEDPLGSGVFDRETLVHWTQAPCGIYVDIRLPHDSPGRSLDAAAAAGFVPNPAGLAAASDAASLQGPLSAQVYESILAQKSFAGQLMMAFGGTGDALELDLTLAELSKNNGAPIPLCTCYWRRFVDYRPPSGGLDVGVCASWFSNPTNNEQDDADGAGTIEMRETGDDGSYAEGWLRLPGSGKGPYMALELVEDSGVPRKGFWVRAGHRFAYAIGRPETEEATTRLKCEPGCEAIATNVGKSLKEATIDDEASALRQVMSYVAVMGTIRDDGAWYIESSTRPDLVGCTLLDSAPGSLACSALVKCNHEGLTEGQYVTQVSLSSAEGSVKPNWERVWRVVETTGCKLPIE
ncbi:hypothetical protein MHU86_19480 [Fragilaria crotonensis]|nr:hypothetical protein MHU86_19480 [Fragilaria crotonensis]